MPAAGRRSLALQPKYTILYNIMRYNISLCYFVFCYIILFILYYVIRYAILYCVRLCYTVLVCIMLYCMMTCVSPGRTWRIVWTTATFCSPLSSTADPACLQNYLRQRENFQLFWQSRWGGLLLRSRFQLCWLPFYFLVVRGQRRAPTRAAHRPWMEPDPTRPPNLNFHLVAWLS